MFGPLISWIINPLIIKLVNIWNDDNKFQLQQSYLSFDVSVEDLPVMDVFETQTDLNEPTDDLKDTHL